MNPYLFIAGRISSKGKENLAAPAIKISILTIGLGLAVMIVSVAVLTGFQESIREKVTGFAAHIQIDNFDANASYEQAPVERNRNLEAMLGADPEIRHIQAFTLKAGIVKTGEEIQGVVLKGVDNSYNWGFFRENLLAGEVLTLPDSGASGGVLISKYLSNRLMLKVGDPVRMYFLTGEQAQPRGRKFEVSGIYETGLEEFDHAFVIGDMRHIQRLNGWTEDQVSGFEVFVSDFSRLDEIASRIYYETGYDLNTQTVRDLYPQIFDWLKLMDMNVIIILVLMICVAGVTMISTLLILVLDRTAMIGVLKALGMNNPDVYRIFLVNSAAIIAKGMAWGNFAGLLVCFLQHRFRIVPLDPESYYMAFVPVRVDLWQMLALNAGTFIVCMAFLVIPGIVISRITPIKAIRFA